MSLSALLALLALAVAPVSLSPEELEVGRAAIRLHGKQSPLEGLFPPQRAFVANRAKRRAALCGRRAGKTTADARLLLQTAQEYPGSISPYFGVTQKVARRLMWPELIRLDKRFGLGLEFNRSELEVHLPNGSEIWVCGAKDESEIEKARGPKYPIAILDECGSFKRNILKQLVDDILTPALMDLDGTLALTGTPGRVLDGLFYDITRPELEKRAKGWQVHSWTALDNVGLPRAKQWIEAEKERRGWAETDAAVQREYRGRWVRSDDSLIYHYDPALNDFDLEDLPSGLNWHRIIGLDVGYRDRTAFVVGQWSEGLPGFYVVHTEARSKMAIEDIAEKLRGLIATYQPDHVIQDCGALGIMIAEELRNRYRLPIEAAEKKEKLGAIEMVNSDLRKGRVFVMDDSPLAEELKILQYNDKGKEDATQRNDLADAFLYAHRMSRHYWFEEAVPPVEPGTAEWAEDIEEKRATRMAEAKWEANWRGE